MGPSNEQEARDKMVEVLEVLRGADKSRENSLAITKLEEAIMWNNKDRAIKGHFGEQKSEFAK